MFCSSLLRGSLALRLASGETRSSGGPLHPSRTPPSRPALQKRTEPCLCHTHPPSPLSTRTPICLLGQDPTNDPLHLLQPLLRSDRINSVMKKLLFVLVPFLGVALAKSEIVTGQKSEIARLVRLEPRKNYRAKLARQYFGSKGGRCHKWNRFCGR